MGSIPNPIAYTSSPVSDALGTDPLTGDVVDSSTLNNPSINSPQNSSPATAQTVASILSDISSTVLSGLAISKLPSGNVTGVNTAQGLRVNASPSVVPFGVSFGGSSGILLFLIVGLIIFLLVSRR